MMPLPRRCLALLLPSLLAPLLASGAAPPPADPAGVVDSRSAAPPEPFGPPDLSRESPDPIAVPETAGAGRIAGTEAARRATVEVVTADEGRRLVLGTLIGRPPVVVTKASELETLDPADLRLRLHDESLVEIGRRLVDKTNDVAVLEPATGLPAGLEPSESIDPAFGAMVLAPIPGPAAQRVGIVGARPRGIEKRGGVLGVRLGFQRGRDEEDARSGVAVEEVYPDSAAAKGGLQVGDRILAVDDVPVPDSRGLQKEIFSHDPGDTVELGVRRGEESLELPITLGYWSDVFDLLERNQQMSGATSRRKTGFDTIIQHDIPLAPSDVGGPLLDLKARMIGLNIARQDRVTTFAIPGRLVRRIVEVLRTAGLEEIGPPATASAGPADRLPEGPTAAATAAEAPVSSASAAGGASE